MAASNSCAHRQLLILQLLLLYAFVAPFANFAVQASGCRTLRAEGGTQSSRPCVFPFRFGGEVYDGCTDILDPDGKFWCSTEVDSSGDHVPDAQKWGHCDPRSCRLGPGQRETSRNLQSKPEVSRKECGTNIIIERDNAGIRLAQPSGESRSGAWPWMISAGYEGRDGGYVHQCGGTVVSPTHVLTAAHCSAAHGADSWVLIFGDTKLNTGSDDIEVATRNIETAHIHPKWKSGEAYYDVAVWEVSPPVAYGKHIRPICLPGSPATERDPYANRAAETMGWGVGSRSSPSPSNVLKSTTLAVYPESYCNESFRSYPNAELVREKYPRLFADGLLMCAGAPTGTRGTCFGDSGGPLIIEETHPVRRFVQIGIVQGGIGACGSAHYPDVFVNVEHFEVYQFISEIMGNGNSTEAAEWSRWVNDGPCSRSCGTGVQRRTRTCPPGSCPGNSESSIPCTVEKTCPIHGGWGPWRNVSECSASCGSGTQVFTRQCNNPVPDQGGDFCSGDSAREQNCNQAPCPINGGWSPWRTTTECSKTCGHGTFVATRQCNNPVPNFGGRYCAGESAETRNCNSSPCIELAEWSPWRESRCSVTCGTGVRTRTRVCSKPGQCSGQSTEGSVCNLRDCPEKTVPSTRPDEESCLGFECCGTNNFLNPYIPKLAEKAHESAEYAFPWMATLGYPGRDDWEHQCGGTVISRRHVLTAAHCTKEEGFSNWQVAFGATSIENLNRDHGIVKRTILDVHVHPKWDRQTAYYDVAILVVDAITYGSRVRRVCLPSTPSDSTERYDGEAAEIMGWGGVAKNKRTPQKSLRHDTLKVYPTSHCNNTYGNLDQWTQKQWYPDLFAHEMICAGTLIGDRGTCVGDSGGPLVIEELHPRRRYVQIGIVQSGVDICGSSDYPDVFVGISDGDVYSFIMDTLQNDDGDTDRRMSRDWTEWTRVGPCSKTCGAGVQRRTRTCPSGDCLGEAEGTIPCNEDPCPIHGGWSPWEAVLDCSVTCGTGTKFVTRQCDNPIPNYGGNTCTGESAKVLDCSKPPCATDEGQQEIMVFGGTRDRHLSDVEVVSLGKAKNCTAVTSLPQERSGLVAQAPFPNGEEVTVCGGARRGQMFKDCQMYNLITRAWREAPFSLSVSRTQATSVRLDNGTMIVFGGRDVQRRRTHRTTEVIFPSWISAFGPDMPYPAYGHCTLKVNSTHVFLAGGRSGGDRRIKSSAYLLDLRESRWTSLPDMELARWSHSCGLANGRDVVVAGGFGDAVEIYSLRSGAWRSGPRLPVVENYRVAAMQAVQLGATFVLTGGQDDGRLLRFDEANYDWIEMEEKLETPRQKHAAVLLPKQSRLCN